MRSIVKFVLFLGVSVSASAQPALNVEVFSDSAVSPHDLPGVTLTYYNLNELELVKARYLPTLPPDPARAQSLFHSFLNSEKGAKFTSEMRRAYKGHQQMVRYQLEKVPAIVFDDGRYVIYGLLDVREALVIYRAAMRKKAGGALQ